MKCLSISKSWIKYLIMITIIMRVHCRIFLEYKMIIKYKDRNKTLLKNQQEQHPGQTLWEDLKLMKTSSLNWDRAQIQFSRTCILKSVSTM
jgi:hypothetical protein